ncbi:MBL fold metallo-hydrolase [Neorhodopirellula pilleata]|uniref:Putative efflux pump membrane fusion protein n=1 Tax=Neorhodopirellula pilleata TaxID=2714738 RepID=A0A5C6A1N4_9BACT|nr:MBL fold metallo-hydrolase [Neorhodopirellula pilleata]TWT93118.1 putative efflux pump membrane fusion protein [Neorhodopirellula pilleata]
MTSTSNQPISENIPESGITYPCKANEAFGTPVEVANGVWWIRLPMKAPLESVNVYALRDGKGLTLVDTGANTPESIQALEAALGSAMLKSLPLRRIIVTHFHPDHIGSAGYLTKKHNASLWMTRTCWLTCQLLLRTSSNIPTTEAVEFMRNAGLNGIQLEAYRRQTSGNYRDWVSPLPDVYVPLVDMETIHIGFRTWKVATGNGHAAEHATLWSQDLAIVGDQILPNISASLTVPFTEPESDLVGEWLRSCQKLAQLANNQLLVLPGHQSPYTGCLNRLRQIRTNVEAGMQRIVRLIATPQSAVDLVEPFHNRSLSLDERSRLLPEIVGYLNHLASNGQLERTVGPEGAVLYGPGKSEPISELIPKARAGVSSQRTTAQFTGDEATSVTPTPVHAAIHETKKPAPVRLRVRSLVAASGLLLFSGLVYASRDHLTRIGNQASEIYPGRSLGVTSTRSSGGELKTPLLTVETYVPVKLSSTQLPRRFTGVVKAKRTSEVGFNRIGAIDSIPVQRGQHVSKNQVLATLNDALLQANLKAIDAQIKAATARLDEMLAGPRSQTIEVARNEVKAAQAELELAQTSFARTQRLVSIGAVSRQAVDETFSQVKSKQESFNATQNSLDELLSGTRSEQVLAQRAVLEELAASKEQLAVQLKESSIVSPFDAIVAERYRSPGSVVSPGEPVVRLVEVAAPEAWIGLPPEYIDRLMFDDPITVSIGPRSVGAKLSAVLPELDPGTRTNTAVFELIDLEPGWGIGRSVEIELTKPMDESGFWVAMSSIIQGDHGLWAVLALEPIEQTDTARLVKRELEVILVDSDRGYVRGTLQEGEPIVAAGLHRLTPGQIVRVDSQVAFKSMNASLTSPTL